jgi:mRNA-degrading endonuclease RelE of RelBE toxin-antitoxin system
LRYKLEISGQVARFIEQLAPEPRATLKRALKNLQDDKGEISSLETPLNRYCRLRVGKYRIIFRYGKDLAIHALFAQERRLVYEAFQEEFSRKLASKVP